MCLEMPTGTGKTVSLLSLIISYQVEYTNYIASNLPDLEARGGKTDLLLSYCG